MCCDVCVCVCCDDVFIVMHFVKCVHLYIMLFIYVFCDVCVFGGLCMLGGICMCFLLSVFCSLLYVCIVV